MLISRFAYVFVQPAGSLYPPILDLHGDRRPVRRRRRRRPDPLRAVPRRARPDRGARLPHRRPRLPARRLGDPRRGLAGARRRSTSGSLDALRRKPHPTHAHLARQPRLDRPRRAAPRGGHQHAQRPRLRARSPPSCRPGSMPAYDGMTIELAAMIAAASSSSCCRSSSSSAPATPRPAAGVFSSSAVDGLMVFTQSFAIPCLLFRALVDLDLGAVFDPRLLLSFYAGAVICFVLGILGARQPVRPPPRRGGGDRLRRALLQLGAARPADHGARLRRRGAGADLRDHLDPRALLLPRRHHHDGVRPRRRPRPRRHRARRGPRDVPQRADDRPDARLRRQPRAASPCPARCAPAST